MSPHLDRVRPRRRLGGVLSDPLRKLLALGLAVTLWLYLDQQVTDTKAVRTWLRQTEPGLGFRTREDHTTLQVRIPVGEFRVVRYLDAVTRTEIDSVDLRYSGPTHLMERLADAGSPRVEPTETELANIKDGFVFDIGRVAPGNLAYQKLLKEMRPASVLVVLDRVERSRLRPTMAMVELLFASEAQRTQLEPQLLLQDARIFPDEVDLVATTTAMGRVTARDPALKLLVAQVPATATSSDTELRVELTARPNFLGVELQPRTVLYVPLRRRSSVFELQVPVTIDPLSVDGQSAEQLQARLNFDPPEPKVMLRAFGQLESELQRMTREQLQTWTRRNARLFLQIGPETNLAESPTLLPLFVMLNSAYRDGHDFQVAAPPTVVVSPRKAP
ncbi:MAG: hypothetical protein IT458_19125 [Planctomycetes bacterium]|nr:hypothetical protein [Planctomycetota bacterium]